MTISTVAGSKNRRFTAHSNGNFIAFSSLVFVIDNLASEIIEIAQKLSLGRYKTSGRELPGFAGRFRNEKLRPFRAPPETAENYFFIRGAPVGCNGGRRRRRAGVHFSFRKSAAGVSARTVSGAATETPPKVPPEILVKE